MTGKNSRFGCFAYDCYPGQVFRYRDTVVHDADTVLFYHRNQNDRLIFDLAVGQQGLEASKERLWNPLANRTFGGRLVGRNMVAAGTRESKYVLTPFRAWKLRSRRPARQHSMKLYLHTGQEETLERWKRGLSALVAASAPTDTQAWEKNQACGRRSGIGATS